MQEGLTLALRCALALLYLALLEALEPWSSHRGSVEMNLASILKDAVFGFGFVFFLSFLGLLLWDVEVPRLGAKLEL